MKIIVFGGNGSIGSEIVRLLQKDSHNQVFCVGHSESKNLQYRFETESFHELLKLGPFDGIVWANGRNINDSILDYSQENLDLLINANLNFILKSLNLILNENAISNKASLVLISSIWQNHARNLKLSYSVSKAALAGLVKSCAIDLGSKGIRVNSVSPGVVLNNMSKKNLSEEQISKISSETPLGHLVTEQEVAKVVSWLLSDGSSGLTGQDITVDGGWTIARYV